MSSSEINRDLSRFSNPKLGYHRRGGSVGKWVPIIIVVIIFIVIINKFSDEPNTPAVIWNLDYPTAMLEAQQQNKPVLIAFHAIWCSPCQQMKKTTYHDPEVIKAVANFIPVMIDADKQVSIMRQYSIDAIPAYIITQPDGTVIDRFEGYYLPADFFTRLNGVLKNKE